MKNILQYIDNSMQGNGLSLKGVSLLCKTLKNCDSPVERLSLAGNQIDDECMEAIGKYLQENDRINHLNLSNNKLTDIGIKILSKHIVGNRSLTILDLSDNRDLIDEAIPFIEDMVKVTCIREVLLEDTSVTSKRKAKLQESLISIIAERENAIKFNIKSASKKS